METYIEAIIIPQASSLQDTLDGLVTQVRDIKDLAVHKAEHSTTALAAIALKVAKDKIPVLDRLRRHVDVIALYSVHQALEENYEHITYSDGSILYSPTAELHEGTMSETSQATYRWRIRRPCQEGEAQILMQEFRGGTEAQPRKSSHHYHKFSTEHWMGFFGKTLLHCTDLATKHPTMKRITKGAFQTLLPHTAHQLSAHTEYSGGVLCIEPYKGKTDHHYLEDDAPTLKNYKGEK
jgi:hypothetical protein